MKTSGKSFTTKTWALFSKKRLSGVTCFLALVAICLTVPVSPALADYTIAQESGPTTSTGYATMGQSFTTLDVGQITQIDFYAGTMNGQTTDLRIYSGGQQPDNPALALYVQTGISVDCDDCWFSVPLSTTLDVSGATLYTFELTNVQWRYSAANPYSGGTMWQGNSSVSSTDLAFRVHVWAVSLALTKVVSPSSAKPGEAITYTISFGNTGAITATHVILTDTLSLSITGANYTSSGVALTQAPGSMYVWTAPDLAPGAGGMITITGQLVKPLAAGTIPNTVTLAVSGTAPVSSDAILTVTNVAPVADAGTDRTVNIYQSVMLDGRGSHDDNGDALTYLWAQTGGPTLTLSAVNTNTLAFTAPPYAAVLTFTLTVTDTGGLASTAQTRVNVVPGSAGPGPWAVTANGGYKTNISMIDTSSDTAYGPFLDGQLGTGGLFDVVVTGDGKTALVSNFGQSTVYKVDISNPISPSVIMSFTMPMFAEDIALAPCGNFALVTDGGFAPYVTSIDLTAGKVYSTNTDSLGLYAQAVDIAPNGTVIIADYFGSRLGTFTADGVGQLTYVMSYTLASRPVNVSIAPDGQTVLVGSVASPTLEVFQITGPGLLTYKTTLTNIPTNTQSIAFNAAGTRAYALNNNVDTGNTLTVLNINAPGDVSVNVSGIALPGGGTSQLFGVDTLVAVGNKAYVSNPTVSGATSFVRVVDLNTYNVSLLPLALETGEDIGVPAGIGAIIPNGTLKLCKSVNPVSAKPGEPITYTITFQNNSGATVTNVVITDTLSSNLGNTAYTSSGVALTLLPGTRYAWNAPDLAPGAGGIITITGVLARPLAAGMFPNAVMITGSGMLYNVGANLTVVNVKPAADAGADQVVERGAVVTLDGSGSTDDNGDALTYTWAQTGGPTVTLAVTNTATITFTAGLTVPTVYTFTLTVNDGHLHDTDEVVVTVNYKYYFPLIFQRASYP